MTQQLAAGPGEPRLQVQLHLSHTWNISIIISSSNSSRSTAATLQI